MKASPKSMSLFDWLKQIINKKSDYKTFSSEDWKSYSPYMISLFLSMNPKYVEFIDMVQELDLNKEKQYRMYVSLIPKNSKTYFPYIKSKTLKLNEDKLKYISILHQCSLREANEYVSIMPKEWLEHILDQYGLEKKEKKKILKLK